MRLVKKHLRNITVLLGIWRTMDDDKFSLISTAFK